MKYTLVSHKCFVFPLLVFYFCLMNSAPISTLNCRGKLFDLEVPKIMGILNITPDSFSDGGKFLSPKNALLQVEKMIVAGADIIDIGAQSTRPNATMVSAKEEIIRLGKIINQIKKEFPNNLISLDTYYADVVRFGADEGIDMINDISGGQFDVEMLKAVADTGLPYILMHCNPEINLMHQQLIKSDILLEVNRYFSCKIKEILE